jgi:hypothetical protein
MYKIFLFSFIALFLNGCSFVQSVRGLPPRETREPEAVQPKDEKPHTPADSANQPLKADPAPAPASQSAPKGEAAAQSLKVDPGFDGINSNSSQAEYDTLLARKKRNVFSLKGEDKPIRSIRGNNAVESEELNKIYDDLDNDRKSGSGVFKFY